MELHPAESVIQESLRQASGRCCSLGFDDYWQMFEEHYLESRDYAFLAREHGIREAEAASRVRIARRLFRKAIRATLAHKDGGREREIEGLVERLEQTRKESSRRFEDLTGDQVRMLLSLALEPATEPLDLLIHRLIEPDGAAWLSEIVRIGPAATFGSPERVLIHGEGSLQQLRAIKEMCKAYFREAPQSLDRLAALAGYLIAVASALVHHEMLITRQGRQTLEATLWELAAAMPEPWRGLMIQAVEASDRCRFGRRGTKSQLRSDRPTP